MHPHLIPCAHKPRVVRRGCARRVVRRVVRQGCAQACAHSVVCRGLCAGNVRQHNSMRFSTFIFILNHEYLELASLYDTRNPLNSIVLTNSRCLHVLTSKALKGSILHLVVRSSGLCAGCAPKGGFCVLVKNGCAGGCACVCADCPGVSPLSGPRHVVISPQYFP